MNEGQVLQCKLITETKKGTRIKSAATLQFVDGRIEFLKSPYSLKDEIKAMKGSKWHGYEEPPRKIWSIEDCPRNRFQLNYLMGENPYEWFDRDLIQYNYERPLMPHQRDLSDYGLTYHYGIWGAEMGTGKTLAAIEVMEKSGIEEWIYCGPKAALKAIEREFKKWKLDPRVRVTLMTYDALVREMDNWPNDKKPPKGVIFDESSRLKTATSQRTRAAQKLGDLIRQHYGYDGYVILMSGTPSPKTPVDWWAQAEIAWPGFLKEGSPKALEQRLAFLVDEQYDSGAFKRRVGWKDDERKCDQCGQLATAEVHDDMLTEPEDFHAFQSSKNEVALMHERLKGLVVVKHKKDCLTLPDKRYRTILCKPNKSTLRVAQALMSSAPNAITGLTLLRELSDGFQYREEADGKTPCTHCTATGEVQEWYDPTDEDRTFSAVDMLEPETVSALEKRTICCPVCGGDKEVNKYIRITREVPCPKEAALVQLLEESEENGRIVVAAGFTGSVDRCVNVLLKQMWDVVRCDGRGFSVFVAHKDGSVEELRGVDALDYWADRDNARVGFVMHPESGGMGLTLVEARMMVFWSNSFKPEYRIQAEDRIHRKGMDENLGCEIVDLIHLPTDQRVVDVIRENRKLELMTLGEFTTVLKDESIAGDGELVEIAA
jgi:hypothetical protein